MEPYKNDPTVFIRYTDLPKIGINPKYADETPAGIYGYPLKIMWNKVVKHDPDRSGDKYIPWKGNAAYVAVFREKGNVIDVADYNMEDLERDKKKLIPFFKKIIERFNYSNPEREIEFFKNWENEASKPLGNGIGYLWNITRMLSSMVHGQGKTSAKWTKILMMLGYDGFTDKTGIGRIHKNEPYQGVFFPKGYQPLAIFPNKRKPEFWEKNPAKLSYVKDENTKKEAQQLILVRDDGNNIWKFENPSEKVQLAAVNQNGLAIKHILEKGIIPSEQVQLAAVEENLNAFDYIIKAGIQPSEQVIAAGETKNLDEIIKKYGTNSEEVKDFIYNYLDEIGKKPPILEISNSGADWTYKLKSWENFLDFAEDSYNEGLVWLARLHQDKELRLEMLKDSIGEEIYSEEDVLDILMSLTERNLRKLAKKTGTDFVSENDPRFHSMLKKIYEGIKQNIDLSNILNDSILENQNYDYYDNELKSMLEARISVYIEAGFYFPYYYEYLNVKNDLNEKVNLLIPIYNLINMVNYHINENNDDDSSLNDIDPDNGHDWDSLTAETFHVWKSRGLQDNKNEDKIFGTQNNPKIPANFSRFIKPDNSKTISRNAFNLEEPKEKPKKVDIVSASKKFSDSLENLSENIRKKFKTI